MSMLSPGDTAPDFTVTATDGSDVTLSEYRGRRVILYFYPRDDTPGCTIQACDFTSGIKDFEKLGAVVLGCSPDDSESHQKFIKKHKLKIHLLSDPSHRVMEKYGAWGEKNMYGKITQGVIRSTVLIDPAGKVAKHWKRVKTKGHAEAVNLVLKQMQST